MDWDYTTRRKEVPSSNHKRTGAHTNKILGWHTGAQSHSDAEYLGGILHHKVDSKAELAKRISVAG